MQLYTFMTRWFGWRQSESSSNKTFEPTPKLETKPQDLPSGFHEFWMTMVIIILGWGLWVWKEVKVMDMKNEVAVAAPVSYSNENPLEEVEDLGVLSGDTTEETLKQIYFLKTFEDEKLSTVELLKKYQNLSMASAKLSATKSGELHQRFWSAQAVEYGAEVLSILENGVVMFPASQIEEANTRLLLAMSMNYFQGGEVVSEELTDQFENIETKFLLKNGFCQNKLLRGLVERDIIELPRHKNEVNI